MGRELYINVEGVSGAAGKYLDFSDRLATLLSHIDKQIDVVEEGALAGDAVIKLTDEYEAVQSKLLMYINQLSSAANMLSTTSSNKDSIDKA